MGSKNLIKHVSASILHPVRNQFILFDVKRRARKKRVNLDYWQKVNNLGDLLSPIIVEYMLSLKDLDLNVETSRTVHLFAIGSILTSSIQDGCVWGSGIRNVHDCYRLSNRALDIRLIRGPLSRMIMQEYGYNVPEKYGDPAVLLNKIYKPTHVVKKYKYGVILHTAHNSSISHEEEYNDTLFINILTDDYKSFVDKVLSCETIISSSLHGIIISETYSIPAILLSPPGDLFKYNDWYYSTNRIKFQIAENIDDARKMKPITIPDLSELQENAFGSFPYDLWMK